MFGAFCILKEEEKAAMVDKIRVFLQRRHLKDWHLQTEYFCKLQSWAYRCETLYNPSAAKQFHIFPSCPFDFPWGNDVKSRLISGNAGWSVNQHAQDFPHHRNLTAKGVVFTVQHLSSLSLKYKDKMIPTGENREVDALLASRPISGSGFGQGGYV